MSGPETSVILSDPVLQKAYLSACVIAGALMCFFGYRAFKSVLGLLGVLIGGYAAAAVGFDLSEGNRAVALFCGLTGGVLGGVLMVTMYLLAVFVLGASLGGIVAGVFTLRANPGTRAIAMSVVAAIGGFLALFIQRFIVIAATALNGAALVIVGLWMLFADLSPMTAYHHFVAAGPGPSCHAVLGGGIYKYLVLGAWTILGCLGAWAQFSVPEKPDEDAEQHDGEE